MLPLMAIGAGMGLLGTIGNMFGRGKANRELDQLMKQDPTYAANPLAQQRLGLSQTLLNARMPGAMRAEQNIFQNQANTMAGAGRSATDGSQLLLAGQMAQEGTNTALGNLEGQEAQDYQRRYGNYANAQDAVIAEGDKVHNDQVRRFGDKVQMKGAQQENRAANWQSLSNAGFGMLDFGMSGGFDKMFGKGKPGGGQHSFLPID